MLGIEHDGRVLGDGGALEVEDLVHVLADHFRDQLELADLADVVDAHEMAVAQMVRRSDISKRPDRGSV